MRKMKSLLILAVTIFVLSSCAFLAPPVPEMEQPTSWQGIPLMATARELSPDSVLSELLLQENLEGYHYILPGEQKRAVEDFYQEQMMASGWDLLDVGTINATGYETRILWFDRGQDMVMIEVWYADDGTHVALLIQNQ